MTTQCPACYRTLEVRDDRIALRAEILCTECGAMLTVLSKDPLKLAEVDLADATMDA